MKPVADWRARIPAVRPRRKEVREWRVERVYTHFYDSVFILLMLLVNIGMVYGGQVIFFCRKEKRREKGQG